MNQLLIDLGLAAKLTPAQAEALSAALDEKQNAVLAQRIAELEAKLSSSECRCEYIRSQVSHAKSIQIAVQNLNSQLKSQVEVLGNELTEATDILENELLPNLEDRDQLIEMISAFRAAIKTTAIQKQPDINKIRQQAKGGE